MPDHTFKIIFLIGWSLAEIIRAPHRRRERQNRRQGRVEDSRLSGVEWVVLLLGLLGMVILPLVYVFTPWLDFANYQLPAGLGWAGAVIFVAALWLLWRGHADLGHSWSGTLEVTQEHKLVTDGVYRHLRHPIYAAIGLSAVAQVLLLHNWLAGPSLLVVFALVCWLRIPREEKMMLENFGDEYRTYMEQTGGIFPRF